MKHPSSMSAEELVAACANSNDDAAWNEFVSRFHRPIALSILRTAYQWGAVAQQVVDDLVQETYLKLCASKLHLLRDFASQHPDAIVPYIKTLAANLAHDHFKALHSQKRGAGESGQPLDDSASDALSVSSSGNDVIERDILLGEINEALEECTVGPDAARDRLIFRLYYQQGMSAKAIAALPSVGLGAKGVESVIYRVTRLLRERLVAMRSEPAGPAGEQEKGLRSAESF